MLLGTTHGVESTFFFDHLILNNFIFNLQFFFFFFFYFLIFIFYLLSFYRVAINNDFFFAILNLIIIMPFIFLSNTFFTFFFLLEVSSCLIMYKFASSRFYYKNTINLHTLKTLEKFNRNLPKNFLNVLFFQY